jgi:hypothetical protein
MSNLPLHGVSETYLDRESHESTDALAEALSAEVDHAELGARLHRLVAAAPTYLDGWAHLAVWALEAGDAVSAYAFARVGYHRGLDQVRKAGWGGQGPVPWHHEPNRGFLRSVHALMRAAALIQEMDEAERCRSLLLELDPDDALEVGELDLEALSG